MVGVRYAEPTSVIFYLSSTPDSTAEYIDCTVFSKQSENSARFDSAIKHLDSVRAVSRAPNIILIGLGLFSMRVA